MKTALISGNPDFNDRLTVSESSQKPNLFRQLLSGPKWPRLGAHGGRTPRIESRRFEPPRLPHCSISRRSWTRFANQVELWGGNRGDFEQFRAVRDASWAA